MHLPCHALALPLLCLCVLPAQASHASTGVTSPEEFLGHRIGADRFLANYTQLRGYWQKLAKESARMKVVNIGTTSYGQPMVMAIITSPANHQKLAEYKNRSRSLAMAKDLDDETARIYAAQARAVVWIDAGMHATECVAAQNIIELVFQMTSRSDGETKEILDNVILLVTPANPDGMEMVAKGYMATGTVGRLPVLYQRYIGHDNNRDFYMANQPETEAINRVLYREWCPQIVYNHHQSAPRGTILFTPPFRDPFNYNFDPMVVRGIALVANHMNSRFSWEQKPGIISRSGARYSTWWNGGLRTTAYFHNMIGILTEAAGSPNPQRLTQTLNRRLPFSDHPDPVPSGVWHARQTIDYLQTANRALLLLAARYRKEFLYNIYQMGRNSIRRGSSDHWTITPKLMAEAKRRGKAAFDRADPSASQEAERATFKDPKLRDARAYVIPSEQLDPAAARRFVGILLKSGVEVHRMTKSAVIAGKRYSQGSFVVRADQAFRPHVRDMLEPQWHPDDIAGGEPVRPYDSAGWTPAMQMDVAYERILDGFEAPLDEVTLSDLGKPEPGLVTDGKIGYLLRPGNSDNFKAINRLLRAKQRVFCLRKPVRISPRLTFPKGTYYVPRRGGTKALLDGLARDLGLHVTGVDKQMPGPALALAPLRIGLFDVYGGNMATGWTQWLLEAYEFPVELVFGKRVLDGDLRKSFDVLLFHTGLPDPGGRGRIGRARRRGRPRSRLDAEQLEKLIEALPPFEDWSTVHDRRVRLTKDKAVPVLRQFVKDGGVLIAVGSQALAAARLFELPVRDGVMIADEADGKMRRAKSNEFFIPGSLININIADNSMVTTGLSPKLAAMFRRSPVFRVRETDKVKVLARYPTTGAVLASGWAIGGKLLRGRAAAMEANIGSGRVYLFGPDVAYRGQPQGTIKLLFNAVVLGSASEVSTTELR